MPLQIIRQDITKMKVDAIVDPTNEYLFPGGGTDAAIHEVAGPKLYKACRKIGQIKIGNAAISEGFRLPAKHVIFTAGPLWKGGTHGERELLESCYKNSLMLAIENGCESVAVPLISSGVYGFPKDQVLKIAINTVSEFLFENELNVYIVVFDKQSYQFSEKLFRDVTEYIDDNYAEGRSFRTRAREGFFERNRSELIEKAEFCDCCYEPTEFTDEEFNSSIPLESCREETLDELLKGVKSKSFALTLFRFIDERGIGDVECYKKANVDKKTFSKIKCNADYKPSKNTVIAFAIALELDLEKTQELLATVGFTLSNSSRFDVIIKYFINRGIYNIHVINETLFELEENLLGSI